jgi:addiction module RelE/StbE family toxin
MRKIVVSKQFQKKLILFLRRQPELENKISGVLKLLEKDLNHPLLKTHKLHGVLSKFFACSITYEYRLVFSFDDKFIFPHTIGSHDDVY